VANKNFTFIKFFWEQECSLHFVFYLLNTMKSKAGASIQVFLKNWVCVYLNGMCMRVFGIFVQLFTKKTLDTFFHEFSTDMKLPQPFSLWNK